MGLSSIVLKAATLGVALFASGAAWSATITSVHSGPGTIVTYDFSTTGYQANPWTISQSITGIAPVVLTFSATGNNPLAGSVPGIGQSEAKWFSISITNNTTSAWTSFDFELQSALGVPSAEGDGLSFAQGNGLLFTSDKFSSVFTIEEERDFVNFANGLVGIGETVTFLLAISDNSANNPFYLSQTPNRVVGEIGETPLPGALPLFVSGIGGIGFFAYRRKRKASAV